MSRRSSNAVRLARASSHHPLDKNGLPILDPPGQANRLPKFCRGPHRLWRVGRRLTRQADDGAMIFTVELCCRDCGVRTTETEVE